MIAGASIATASRSTVGDLVGTLVGMSGLSRSSAERILHRATELDEVAGGEHGPTPDALRQAASEVGISPAAIERALAEERLRLALRVDDTVHRRLAGADRLISVAEGGHDAPVRVDDALRRRAGFRLLPTVGPTQVYERRSDPVAKVQGAVRRFKGSAQLQRPPRVEVASALFGERVLVGVVADLRGERLVTQGAAGSLTVGGAATAAVLGLVATPWLLLIAPAAAVVGAGIAVSRRATIAAAQRDLDAFVVGALIPDPPALEQRHRRAISRGSNARRPAPR